MRFKGSKSARSRSRRGWAFIFLAMGMLATGIAAAASKAPVRIAVITGLTDPTASGMATGAELASDEINATGGIGGQKLELIKYDDHGSAAEGVRAFQRAVRQDHAVAVLGGYVSEIALAEMQWAARLHEPFIAGGASNDIATTVHSDYARYKYVFEETPNSYYLTRAVCDISNSVLVKHFGFKSAVILSEDLAWTKPLDTGYEQCLPKAGLKILDVIRYAPTTTDFTPIFAKIESLHAGVIIGGLSHTGLAATVQWHQQQVPALFAGFNAMAGASSFWQYSNGATEGVITWNAGAPGAAVTPRSIPFEEAYQKRFGSTPTLSAFQAYDSIYALKQAIERAHSTEPDALVAALEKTDLVGASGRVRFYGPEAKFTHDVQYGENLVRGVGIQWQNGKQVAIWPPDAANGTPLLPSFVRAPKRG